MTPTIQPSAGISVTVRLYAAARAAARLTEADVEIERGSTVEELLRRLTATYGPHLGVVLERCSLLLNEVAIHTKDVTLTDGDQIDVLPPFAGG